MERINRSQHNEAMLLPFSGLGIPLSDVAARATLCELTPVTVEYEDRIKPVLPESLPVCNGYGSGFNLLIALGREIRGR
ncbi:hypothetical protein [Halodesulfovibrio spirochaetisodalis]|uniref:Uncharacterized protein n=1 Tax=Halodesulfovibrio spirochaetisodalis TaxID=1560234 RepID=A0A1B7X9J7_9BACT|nr:hypothetical protein [Halodesulfovibrio spirochaetisodalis]OBQ45970.1 hypothetical protein SP90_15250 [Halodesulfovibrio spirochaetisodalis]